MCRSAPAPVQPEPLLRIFADPALDHVGDRLRRALDVDLAIGRPHRLHFLRQFGAEAVAENGGVVNKVGTLTVACCARAMRRPLYVAAESYKFARAFPLGQRDLPNADVDYTPPDFIELLFTDLGVLTPAAVSDELIRLYQ